MYLNFLTEHDKTIEKNRRVIFEFEDDNVKEIIKDTIPIYNGDISSISTKWSNKSIRQMAEEANELTEYLMYYPYLCSYSHGDIASTKNYGSINNRGFVAKANTNSHEIFSLYNRAAQFFTCFVITFGQQFDLDIEDIMIGSWNIKHD